jgi:hypothetical protein
MYKETPNNTIVEVQTMESKLEASPKEAQSLSSGRKHGGWITFPFFIGLSLFPFIF